MADDDILPVGSDIDMVIVTEQENPPLKIGKFIYRDTLIEVTYLSWNQLRSVKEVLTSCHLAGSFRVDTIIADPTGELRKLQAQIARHFAEQSWVRRRCKNEHNLRSLDPSVPWHWQVMSWLFSTGVTTHDLLASAFRNPTVRLRYQSAREVLMEYGYSELYTDLLKLLGCADWTAQTSGTPSCQTCSNF